jgi:O-antigen/teichoic acid export membrane protein
MSDNGSGLLVALIVSRELGPSGLGDFSVAIAVGTVIALLAEFGGSLYLTVTASADPTAGRNHPVHLAATSFIVGSALVLITWSILSVTGFSPTARASIAVAAIAAIPQAISIMLESLFVVHQRVRYLTMVTLTANVTYVVGALLVVRAGNGPVGILTLYLVLRTLVACSYAIVIHLLVEPLSPRLSKSTFRSIARELPVYSGSTALAALFARPELILVWAIAGPVPAGYYAAAAKLVDAWYIVSETVSSNVLPLLSRDHAAQERQRLQFTVDQSLRALLTVSIGVFVMYEVLAEPGIRLVYGSSFLPAAGVLRILACGIPLFFFSALSWRILSAQRRQPTVLRIQAFLTVLRIAAAVIVIHAVGVVGAAAVATVSLAAYCLLTQRQVARSPVRLRPLVVGWWLGPCALFCGLLTWLVLAVGGPYAATVAGAAGYGLALLAVAKVSALLQSAKTEATIDDVAT